MRKWPDNMGLIASLADQVAAIAADRQSGASALTRAAYGILEESFAHHCTLEVAVGLCRAQPAMASIWNAALFALSARGSMERWEQKRLRAARADRALERVAVASLSEGATKLHVVTCSMSGTVLRILRGLHAQLQVDVSCSESRPLYEGRRLAETLAADGISVTFYTDAALGIALNDADVVLAGADAVGPSHWINKAGTAFVAAAAHYQGVAVHVLATDDKLVVPALWPYLSQPDHEASEVWDEAPTTVRVRNPYFEPIPLDLATSVITDTGVLGSDLVRDACAARDTPPMREALAELLRARAGQTGA
jgi:translation initiation factor 2B subunit (eIF-2B alpha/beta/delta family)